MKILNLNNIFYHFILGQAICKSLDKGIADCMGMSTMEIIYGLVRLLFVRCVAVQLDASHALCQILGKLVTHSFSFIC